MSSVNQVTLVGNLGKDPEIKNTGAGKPFANLSIATSDRWKDRQTGERKEKTEWHRVVIFNEHLVKVAHDWLKKGSKVFVQGKLQTRKWTTQDGQERYTTEVVLSDFDGKIVLLGGREDGGGEERPAGRRLSGGQKSLVDDDIPF